MIALLVKAVIHHAVALLGASFLLLCGLFVAWALVLGQEMPTLITSATGTAYYLGPVFILYVNERLVARDRLDGTSEFLAALPLGRLHRLVLPYLVGLAVVAAAFESLLLLTAMVASRREGLPLGWLVQIHVQLGLFALAWHSLAFGVAHLGRYRWLAWWLFLVFVAELDGTWMQNPWRDFVWTAPLADAVEQTRSVPPWSAIPVTLGWTGFGWLLALGLDGWRGGVLPARWYAPATARQRAAQVVVALVAIGIVPVVGELAPVPDAWRTLAPLPATHAEVRLAGRALDGVGRDVVARLDRLGETAGVERWPGVVLHPTARGLHRHVRRAVGRDDRNLVLLVDPSGPPEALARAVVHEVLVRQTGDLASRVPGVSELLHGLAAQDLPPGVRDARLRHVDRSDAPYREVWLTDGEDIAEAVAAVRVGALDAPTRTALVRSVLGRQRGVGVFSLVGLRWAAWDVPEALALPVPAGDGTPLARPVLLEETGIRAQISFVPPDTVLQLLVLDPLQPLPEPLDVPRPLPVRGRLELALPVDGSQAFAVRLARYAPELEGWITSAWVVR